MSNHVSNKVRAKNRRSLVLLVLVFCLPMIIAWFVLKNINTLKPTGSRNLGELVTPARPLTKFELQKADRNKFTLTELRGKWSVFYFGKSDCDGTCHETLSKIHQARLGQGKEMHRVHIFYVKLDNGEFTQKTRELLSPLKEFSLLSGEQKSVEDLAAQFKATGHMPEEEGRIFLVDPIGNIMMTYSKSFVVLDLLKDLEHLLKYSQIG